MIGLGVGAVASVVVIFVVVVVVVVVASVGPLVKEGLKTGLVVARVAGCK